MISAAFIIGGFILFLNEDWRTIALFIILAATVAHFI